MGNRAKNKIFYKNSFPVNNRIAITTGDPRGIGSHVITQSLSRLGPQKNFQFILWSDKKKPPFKIKKFKTKTFHHVEEALATTFKSNTLLEIKSSKPSWFWVKEAGTLCLNKKIQALITGPVDKRTMKGNPYKALSQTPLLQKLSKAPSVSMTFMGNQFNVILLTDHCPLKKVHLKKTKLISVLREALNHRFLLSPNKKNKPIGLLGFNPHGGEDGILGSEEEKILKPLVKTHFSSKEVQGPLSPDTAFLKKNWSKYSFYLALYHDQGLIPFKTVHSHKGYTFSLGLPFLRLGVDHGTGYGLKPSEISWDSFFQATQSCIKLIKRYRKSK